MSHICHVTIIMSQGNKALHSRYPLYRAHCPRQCFNKDVPKLLPARLHCHSLSFLLLHIFHSQIYFFPISPYTWNRIRGCVWVSGPFKMINKYNLRAAVKSWHGWEDFNFVSTTCCVISGKSHELSELLCCCFPSVQTGVITPTFQGCDFYEWKNIWLLMGM